MAANSDNMCLRSAVTNTMEPSPLQCCGKTIDNNCFSTWVNTCRVQDKPITCPQCRRHLTEKVEVVEEEEVNYETDLEGMNFFSILNEEMTLAESSPMIPQTTFSEEFF